MKWFRVSNLGPRGRVLAVLKENGMPKQDIPEEIDPIEAEIGYELLWEFGEHGRRILEAFGGPGFVDRVLTSK